MQVEEGERGSDEEELDYQDDIDSEANEGQYRSCKIITYLWNILLSCHSLWIKIENIYIHTGKMRQQGKEKTTWSRWVNLKQINQIQEKKT